MTIFYAIIGIPLFLLYLSNIGDIMAKSFKWTYSRLCKCQRGQKPPEMVPSGILKKPDAYRIHSLPQHIHGMANTSSVMPAPTVIPGQEDSSSSLNSAGNLPSSEYSDDFQPKIFISSGANSRTVNLEDVTVPISLCLLVMVSYVVGGALLFSEWEGWGYLDGSYFCFITLSTIGFGDMVPGEGLSTGPELSTVAPVNSKFVLCSAYILIGMALIAMCFNLMQEKVIKGVRSLGRRLASRKNTNAAAANIEEE